MNRAEARLAVYPLLRRRLEVGVEFDDSSALQALGLDAEDIETLLWQLEDGFDLRVSTSSARPGLAYLERVGDLVEWLQVKVWQNR